MSQPVHRRFELGPSVLSADFLKLGEQLAEMEAAGADYIHFDVMDGQFVPNISIGLPILASTRAGTSLPIDVHLMTAEPDRWIGPFADAGASRITFHAEATPHLHRVAQAITAAGCGAGIAINPATPVTAVIEVLPFVQQVLVMTVNPGFGGQEFIDTMPAKIARLREIIATVHPECAIQVDGGIHQGTIARVVDAGATSIVAGSAVINSRASITENIAALRSAAG